MNAANRREPAATRYFVEAQQLAKAAAAIPKIKGATRFDGLIQIADAVLDRFVTDVPTLLWTAAAERQKVP